MLVSCVNVCAADIAQHVNARRGVGQRQPLRGKPILKSLVSSVPSHYPASPVCQVPCETVNTCPIWGSPEMAGGTVLMGGRVSPDTAIAACALPITSKNTGPPTTLTGRGSTMDLPSLSRYGSSV